MKQLLIGSSLTVWILLLSGCQCSGLTDRYADVIDDVADSGPRLDCLYTPCLDLTRIGKPDWCQCGLSGLFCRRGCCDGSWDSTMVPCPDCGRYHTSMWTTTTGTHAPEIIPESDSRPVMPTPEAPPEPAPSPEAPPAPTPPLTPPTLTPTEPVFDLDH